MIVWSYTGRRVLGFRIGFGLAFRTCLKASNDPVKDTQICKSQQNRRAANHRVLEYQVSY